MRQQSLDPLPAVTGLAPTARPGRRWAVVLSACLLAGGFALWIGTRPRTSTSVPPDLALAAEFDGAISDWVLALAHGESALFQPSQVALVAEADAAIRFHLHYGDEAQRKSFERALKKRGVEPGERVRWHKAPRRVWPWVRDLFLAGTSRDGRPVTFLPNPEHKQGWADGWNAEAAPWIAAHLEPAARVVQTPARLDGGAVVADEQRVLVSRHFVEEALQRGETKDAARYVRRMREFWGKPIETIGLKGVHASRHCDLVLMPVGGGRVLLSSPALGARLLETTSVEERKLLQAAYLDLVARAPEDHGLRRVGTIDLVAELLRANTRRRVAQAYAGVRGDLERLGYEVIEIPQLTLEPALSRVGATFAYVNAVMDERAGRRRVYMPSYRMPTLDRHAAQIWRRLGFDVVKIDCLGAAFNGGGVRCMSQVFRRPR